MGQENIPAPLVWGSKLDYNETLEALCEQIERTPTSRDVMTFSLAGRWFEFNVEEIYKFVLLARSDPRLQPICDIYAENFCGTSTIIVQNYKYHPIAEDHLLILDAEFLNNGERCQAHLNTMCALSAIFIVSVFLGAMAVTALLVFSMICLNSNNEIPPVCAAMDWKKNFLFTVLFDIVVTIVATLVMKLRRQYDSEYHESKIVVNWARRLVSQRKFIAA